ncbi:MAG: hypothetical protein ABFD76_10090 [Smithella sp.]
MIIAIDFDGTICFDAYPEIGCIQPYAAETINKLHAAGHYIIINTCREGNRLNEAINWLLEKGIRFNRVNDNHPAAMSKYGSNSRKIFADVVIDDRNLGGFPGWVQVYNSIEGMTL